MYSSVKSKPQISHPKMKYSSPSLNNKTNGSVVQDPMRAENNVSKIAKLSKVSVIPANVATEGESNSISTKTVLTSLKFKGIYIPALYNIGEIDKLKEDMWTDHNKKKGIQIQKVKPFIQQKPRRTSDEVKNVKAFTTSKVDTLDLKTDSVQKGIQQREGQDEQESDIVKNIRHLIQQKPDSINECDIVKDIKPVISSKIGDVNFSSASNGKPTVQHIIDPSDDDSDIEIEEINIVTKTKEPQAINYPEGGSANQVKFIKTIMKQVEELETTLGSQLKQKNEELLKERKITEQLTQNNSILKLKEQERKLSTEKYVQTTRELSIKIEKQQKAVDILKNSLKLKDEEYKSAVQKHERETSELSQMLLRKENNIKMLNENWDLKERERKLAIDKHENKTEELLKKVSQKDIEMDLLTKKFNLVSNDFKNLKNVSDKQINAEKETVKKLINTHSIETSTLNNQISALQKSTQEGNNSIVYLNDTIDSLNNKIAKKSDLDSELKLKVSKLIAEFTKGYKDKDDQIDSKTKQIQEITIKAENLATKVSDLQKDVATKVNMIQILEQDKETSNTKIANLKQELSTKKDDISTNIAMNSRQVALIADLSKTVLNLENDVAAKDKEILSLRKDLNTKVNDLETKNVMNKRQSSILGEISKNLDDLTKAKSNLERSHILIKTEHQDLSTRFQNLEKDYKQTCFAKKQLQDRLYKIKTKTVNKIALTDDDIFEDRLEQTFYNSKRKEGIAETLMITYNWPILSVEVDSRVLKDSKSEDKKVAFKQYSIQGVPLMVTYLWPIVPHGTGRGLKRRKGDNGDNLEVNKRLRLSDEGKKALYNSTKVEMEDLLMFLCNGPVLSVDSDVNMPKAVKSGGENLVSHRDVNIRPLMLTYLWPVLPLNTKTPDFRGLKRSNQENEDVSVSTKRLKVSMEAGSVSVSLEQGQRKRRWAGRGK